MRYLNGRLGGPTNSGKTYQALQRLRQADPEQGGGLYCGPLRLLALEVYESLNRSGIYCDLRTGQEIRTVPLSTHVSSTLEMVNLNKEYDVVVIDEIQMIADAQRGYAWTKTVLGIQANEIHVCGGLEAFEIVKALMEQTQDSFELCKYERMSNLV
jgi:ATP-dependent RNA helicase SUPV3L1/SUV3